MRMNWIAVAACLLIAAPAMAQDANAQETIARAPAMLADKAAPVTRVFYNGTLSWYWSPGGASSSISGRGYATTPNGGTISQVKVCFYNESAFSRNFRATASVVQGSTTIQALTFQSSFLNQRHSCHTLNGFNAVVAPGEFQVVSSFNQFEADNIFAGLSSTETGDVFDVQIGSARPPFATGPQGPLQIRGVGITYRIAENDAPPPPPPGPPPPPPACVADGDTLCLKGGRFKVEATWNTDSASGAAQVVKLTDETGYLWFFNQTNVESVVKILDGCALNNRFWIFAGGLTDQGVEFTVTDTLMSVSKTYTNPRGQVWRTIADIDALATCP